MEGDYTQQELVLVKASLGRLNVVALYGYDVRTEARPWQVILRSVSRESYAGRILCGGTGECI